MEVLHNIGLGLTELARLDVLVILMFGTFLGIIIGVIPGLTATMAVALAVPITFSMDAMTGLALLISMYVGGMTGGLVSAILLNIPGTPASIATTYDGYPMAQKGQPGKALGLAVTCSFLGGGFSYLVLLTISPLVARVAVNLSYFDIFSVVACALVMIADSSQGTLIKSLIAGFIGIMVGVVGPDPISGISRMTFGYAELNGGFAQTSILVGLFAFSQLLADVRMVDKKLPEFTVQFKDIVPKARDLLAAKWNILRSSVIGTFIGIIPGVGATTAGIIAYNQAKNSSKNPEKFGTGEPAGVIASESANNAVSGGAMVPLLTLGLPGCPVAALLLSGLIVKDLAPGPGLFNSNPGIVYGFFLAFMAANAFMFLIMMSFIKPLTLVLKIPKFLLIGSILSLCVIGAYVTNNRMMDVWVLFGFGLFGFFMDKLGYSLGPMVLGIILGPIAELQLRRGLSSSDGSFLPLVTSPVSLAFLIIAAIVLVLPFYQQRRQESRRRRMVSIVFKK